jgi:hypothetical protein
MSKVTLAFFKDWLDVHGCKYEPVDGFNHTRPSIKVTNPKLGRFIYLTGPFDDRVLPSHFVRRSCDTLGVQYPDCVAEKSQEMDLPDTDSKA